MKTPLIFALRSAPRYLTAICLLAGAALIFVGCQKREEEPKPTFLNWASDPLLVEKFYSQRSRMVANVGADGAVSVNREWQEGKRPEFFIEQQRYGVDLIIGGLVSDQQKLIDEGIRMLDWGFARQGPEGDFPGTGDPMHSTSFFVEAASRAALAMKESGRPDLMAKAVEWTPKIHAAARWMARPEEIARHRKMDLERYVHRYYLRAAALAQTAQLTGDDALMEPARIYIEEGLGLQQNDGINPERGGFDASYQAAGLYYALLAWLATEDETLRIPLANMMHKGFAPLLTRLTPEGEIRVEDSTRATEVGRTGQQKRVAYRVIIPTFLHYYKLTGDEQYAAAAKKIAEQAWP